MTASGFDSLPSASWLTPASVPSAFPTVPAPEPTAPPTPAPAVADLDDEPEPETDLARLTRLIRSNDRYLEDLRGLRSRLDLARDYLADPASPALLAQAYHDRLRARQSRTLALLRANRIEALALLASLNS